MKKIITFLTNDKLTIAGFMLVILSAAVFTIASLYDVKDSSFGSFLSTTVITIGFMIAVFLRTLRDHRWRLSRAKQNIPF